MQFLLLLCKMLVLHCVCESESQDGGEGCSKRSSLWSTGVAGQTFTKKQLENNGGCVQCQGFLFTTNVLICWEKEDVIAQKDPGMLPEMNLTFPVQHAANL